MRISVLCLVVVVAGVVGAAPADDGVVERLLKKVEEMEKNYEKVARNCEDMKQKLDSLSVSAAFSTRLHEDTTIGNSPVIFGTVDLNIGDGYDEFTGVFEPPVSGVYILTVYAVTTTVENGPIFIKNNDVILCEGYVTSGGGSETGTCSAVAELAVGDSVRVTGDSSVPGIISAERSGFAGHIIVGES